MQCTLLVYNLVPIGATAKFAFAYIHQQLDNDRITDQQWTAKGNYIWCYFENFSQALRLRTVFRSVEVGHDTRAQALARTEGERAHRGHDFVVVAAAADLQGIPLAPHKLDAVAHLIGQTAETSKKR